MINADHAPATKEEKERGMDNVFDAPFGIPGIETVLPLLLNGVNDEKITLNRVAEVFSTTPAKVMGIYPKKGALRVGSDADFVIADMNRKKTLRNEDVVAKCGWTPYDGLTITGIPEATHVRGKPVVEDGEIIGEPGYGEFIARP
jgi:dihydroorotase-like cyclic amidohydrolase